MVLVAYSDKMAVFLAVLMYLLPVSCVTASMTTTYVYPNSSNGTLEYYLCRNDTTINLNNTTLVLLSYDIHTISSGSTCIVQNVHNLVITSEQGSPSTVICRTSKESNLTSRGFGFAYSTNITISNVNILHCGGIINDFILFQLEKITSVHVYRLQAVFVFLYVYSIQLLDTNITQYNGFGVVGVNTFGVTNFNGIFISDSNLYAVDTNKLLECSNLNDGFCTGSGIYLLLHGLKAEINNDIEIVVTTSSFLRNYNHIFNLNETTFNDLLLTGAGGVTFHINNITVEVTIDITQSRFENNTGIIGGGSIVSGYNAESVNLTVSECLYSNNSAYTINAEIFIGKKICMSQGFGLNVFMVDSCKLRSCNISIVNSIFEKHTNAQLGSGIYTGLFHSAIHQIMVKNVTCFKNQANEKGDCVMIYCTTNCVTLILEDMKVENNGIIQDRTFSRGVVAFSNILHVYIIGSKPDEARFVNNAATSICATGSHIFLRGYLNFFFNHGVLGGAISATLNSIILFEEEVNATFIGNRAQAVGGAIYAAFSDNLQCVIEITLQNAFIYTSHLPPGINITMINNTALLTGYDIFAFPIYNCSQRILSKFKIDQSQLPAFYRQLYSIKNATQLSSKPQQICFCNESNAIKINCFPDDRSQYNTYPGKSFHLNVITVDASFNPVYSPIVISLSKGSWYIKDNELIEQTLPTQCNTIPITVYNNSTDNCGMLFLTPYETMLSLTVDLCIENCPPGFYLSHSTQACECLPLLTNNGIQCDVSSGSITILYGTWVGEDTSTNVTYFSNTCPLGYCEYSAGYNQSIVLTDLSTICAGNRQGAVCGECNPGYSVMFGSVKCRLCSNYYLFTIIGFALAGVLLVIVLLVLQISISSGTITGLIFFANLFATTNRATIEQFPSAALPSKVIFVWISLLNLDLGFPLCFYDGMTNIVSTALQFLFPLYLFLIVIAFIVVSKFSTTLARKTSRHSVQVLATLIFISYAKLVNASIEALGFITVETGSTTSYRWYTNGNILYFQYPPHIALGMVSLFMIIFLILPYTIMLTVLPFMSKYKLVNKFRPFLEAHFGPYKDKWRFWFGVRLWVIFIISIVQAVLNGIFYTYLLLVEEVILVIFISFQAYVRPFKSHAINILDLTIMIVYTILAIGTSATLFQGRESGIIALFTLGTVSIGFVFILFWIVIGYHAYKAFNCRENCQILCRKKSENEYDNKMIDLSQSEYDHINGSNFAQDFNGFVLDLSNAPPDLRESLLSDHLELDK